MTKVSKKVIRCVKCGNESEQLVIYSVNSLLGPKSDDGKLVSHQQVCPKCNYSNFDVSVLADVEDKKNE